MFVEKLNSCLFDFFFCYLKRYDRKHRIHCNQHLYIILKYESSRVLFFFLYKSKQKWIQKQKRNEYKTNRNEYKNKREMNTKQKQAQKWIQKQNEFFFYLLDRIWSSIEQSSLFEVRCKFFQSKFWFFKKQEKKTWIRFISVFIVFLLVFSFSYISMF